MNTTPPELDTSGEYSRRRYREKILYQVYKQYAITRVCSVPAPYEYHQFGTQEGIFARDPAEPDTDAPLQGSIYVIA